jgi:hypothetical protein
VGGEGCNECGQCCRDDPWPPEGYVENGRIYTVNGKGACIYYRGD